MNLGRALRCAAGLVAVLGLVTPAAASADVGVVGGGSFNDAEPLEAGTFEDRIELDQTLYYRLPRGGGQTLTLAVEARGDERDPLPAAGTLELALFDDARVPAGLPDRITAPLDGKRAEVRAADEEVAAGDVLAAVGLLSDGLEPAEGGPYDLTLTVTLNPPVAPAQSPAPAPSRRSMAPQPGAPRPRPAAQLLAPPTPPQQPIVIAGVAFVVGFGLSALRLTRTRHRAGARGGHPGWRMPLPTSSVRPSPPTMSSSRRRSRRISGALSSLRSWRK